MKRRLFALIAAMSLLMWITAVVLWVRSYFGSDYLSIGTPYGYFINTTYVGGVAILGGKRFDRWAISCEHMSDPVARDELVAGTKPRFNALGFGYGGQTWISDWWITAP